MAPAVSLTDEGAGDRLPYDDGRPSEDDLDQNYDTEPLLRQSHDPATTGQDAALCLDDATARRVLWKIDRTIIPLLFITYMLNFMDKTILSNASVFGLPEDNHLEGQQYSWVSSIFYFGYLIWTYPTTMLIARLPTGKYLTANTLFWGTVVALTAACHSFGGLMTVRFLLGVAEATITPGFMFLTSTWYTRDEMPTRVGTWFAGNSVGGLVSSILAYGVGHIEGEIRPWRWMYIILGIMTFLWALPMFFLLPDTISKAKFLTPEERQVAATRTAIAGTGSTENKSWKWEQVQECLIDPKTWLIFAIELLTQIPNGGSQSFANIVVKSFGFTSLQTTLINIPYSLISTSIIMGSGYLAGRFQTLNCILIMTVITPCILGSAIIYKREHVPHGFHLFAYFLLSSGPAAMPLNMALLQSNYRGVTKKMTITALLFLAYCGGNIAGPHFFRKSEDPTYETAFGAIVVCYSMAIIFASVLRSYLYWANQKRIIEEGVEGSASTAGVGPTRKPLNTRSIGSEVVDTEIESRSEVGDDTTDWNTVGFRYRL